MKSFLLILTIISSASHGALKDAIEQTLAKKNAKSHQVKKILKTYPRILNILDDLPSIKSARFQVPSTVFQLQMYKLRVLEEYDDWTNDDLYVYLFYQVDQKPFAKVTMLYQGLDEDEEFLFHPNDRQIYPLPSGHVPFKNLLIDYGIVESDQRDIDELSAISQAIVDLALAVSESVLQTDMVEFSEEVAALNRALMRRDDDDFLVTHTLLLQPSSRHRPEGEWVFKHLGERNFSQYEYWLHFRWF